MLAPGTPDMVPSGSPERRPVYEGVAPKGVPALLKPITAWPWPVAAIDGIQYCADAASVLALSYTVPD